MRQKAIANPNVINSEEDGSSVLSLRILAAIYGGVAVVVSVFTSH